MDQCATYRTARRISFMVIILQHCGDAPATSGLYLAQLFGEELVECRMHLGKGREKKLLGDYDQAAQSDLCVWFRHFCKKVSRWR